MLVLLVTPPLMQLNAPYPATSILAGFLRMHGINVCLADASLALSLRIFSRTGLEELCVELEKKSASGVKLSKSGRVFLKSRDRYIATIEPVIRFLQGRDPTLASRIVTRHFLPEGIRFKTVDSSLLPDSGPDSPTVLTWHFGDMGTLDQAMYLASLYIDDLTDVIRTNVDPHFELSRYAEKLSLFASNFDALDLALKQEPTWIDRLMEKISRDIIKKYDPMLVGFTVPFPGNLYPALRMAYAIKNEKTAAKIVLGGGYVNTELRSMKDPRVFDYVDFIAFDDGELPLMCLAEYILGKRDLSRVPKVMRRENGNIVRPLPHIPSDHPMVENVFVTPIYDGLNLDEYISVVEFLNPMYRMWSDGRWNKLQITRGCYWRKCAFCDTSLEYIARYVPCDPGKIVDVIEEVIRSTGQTGFHFVDEASPPALLLGIAEEILKRKLSVTWWGNIRFERAYTRDLVKRLVLSGCVAMTAGLETTCDRTLSLMNKGITVEQSIRVASRFAAEGAHIHAYLMYNFPGQTLQETVDALEIVRQMFLLDCIHSGYWHSFALSVHSPISQEPEKFGISLLPVESPTFAQNEIPFKYIDGNPLNPEVGDGLNKGLYNFMQGLGLHEDIRVWFSCPVPRPSVKKNFVEQIVREEFFHKH